MGSSPNASESAEHADLKELFAAKFAFHYRQSAFGPPLSAESGLAALEALDASYEAFDAATQVLLREAAGQFVRVTRLTGVPALSVDLTLKEYAERLKSQATNEQVFGEAAPEKADEHDDIREKAVTSLKKIASAPLTALHGDNLHTFHWLSHGALYDHPSGEGFVITLQFGGVTAPLLEMAAHLDYERPALPVWLQVA